jgi:predicted transcriptional regulator
MKKISLKLDENIFDDAEQIASVLKLDRNRYINEAVNMYNLYNKRMCLKKQLAKESALTFHNSMEILHELEEIIDTI